MKLFNSIKNTLSPTKREIFDAPNWQSFSFGEPEKIDRAAQLSEMNHSWNNGRYYEPPISLKTLANAFTSTPYHSSGLIVKRNILTSTLIPNRFIDISTFEKAVFDSLIFANGYFRKIESRTGKLLRLEYLPSLHTRRMNELDKYCYIKRPGQIQEFKQNEVFHYIEPDFNQEIYGVPEYLSALQSAWLNESATLFRRRYYDNGTHAGFIMYVTDQAYKEQDINALRSALKESKGPGNFRNLFLYAPGGNKDGIKLIPISEVSANDEFQRIKTTTRDDLLAAHRVPPQLMSIPATNTGGYGPPGPVAQVFYTNEIIPLQNRWKALNNWAGSEVIKFKDYSISDN